ncbi:hypothetical protein CBF31_06080 [Vagococcus fessus]|uniref:Uncharacterized protein n=2 Tax=Vagococcus fessus TaxID=120370 RepID=A0A430A884_9ENTE|nr:hypothetical protein CBF31_06080 [Vagococcus fessus]
MGLGIIKRKEKKMPRKKMVTRSDIIEAGFMQLITKGPKGFSSRKIAHKLNCSTQPIYLEFKNMDELHVAVLGQFEKIIKRIDEIAVEHTDPLIAANLKILNFAKNEGKIFKALFLREDKIGEDLKRFCRKIVLSHIDDSQKYREVSSEMKETLFSSTLLLTMGVATMRLNGSSNLDNDKVVSLLEAIVDNRLAEPGEKVLL